MSANTVQTRRRAIAEAKTPRFTTRVCFFETPEVARKLELAAIEEGLSTSAAVRAAVRYWLGDWQPDDEDNE